MTRIVDRLGFALAGALGIALVAVLAGFVQAGPLDPPGTPPAPTDSVRLPGTPISSVPLIINTPGHYYFTRNLTVTTNASGIIVNADDVSIDLGGFTLSGNDSPIHQGIRGDRDRLTVSNGTVRDFGTGISLTSADDARITDVRAVSNGYGITLGPGNVLSDCIVAQNAFGVEMARNFSEIRDCNINTSTFAGVLLPATAFGVSSGLIDSTSIFANNQANSPDYGGIMLDGQNITIRDGEFANNARRDIHVGAFSVDSIIIDSALSCPTWITGSVASTYAPVNAADPHTNRSHMAACP